MAVRQDEDLNFLYQCSSTELNNLVLCLTQDTMGIKRFNEELTNSKEYKLYYPFHKKYLDLIIEEIQRYGGNSIVNLLRLKRGVKYKEILIDVCDKLKIEYPKKSSTVQIEDNLIYQLTSRIIEGLKKDEKKQFFKYIFEDSEQENIDNLSVQQLFEKTRTTIRNGGDKALRLTSFVVDSVLKGFFKDKLASGVGTVAGTAAVNGAALSYSAAIPAAALGPIVVIATAIGGSIWATISISGPAYRVTIPVVLNIIYLRRKKAVDAIKGIITSDDEDQYELKDSDFY